MPLFDAFYCSFSRWKYCEAWSLSYLVAMISLSISYYMRLMFSAWFMICSLIEKTWVSFSLIRVCASFKYLKCSCSSYNTYDICNENYPILKLNEGRFISRRPTFFLLFVSTLPPMVLVVVHFVIILLNSITSLCSSTPATVYLLFEVL